MEDKHRLLWPKSNSGFYYRKVYSNNSEFSHVLKFFVIYYYVPRVSILFLYYPVNLLMSNPLLPDIILKKRVSFLVQTSKEIGVLRVLQSVR